MGRTGLVDGRKAEEGMGGCWRIAREISELEYIWEEIREKEDGGIRQQPPIPSSAFLPSTSPVRPILPPKI